MDRPSPPRVLIVHNAYQIRGGEDAVVEAESALLQRHGHAVDIYRRHNDEIGGMSRAALAVQTVWSKRTVADLDALIEHFRPNVVHVHNVFPLISGAAHWSAHRAGVPVVQTLHNFRLGCLQAMWLRDNRVCEDCLGHLPWRGVVHGCYRDSRLQSALAAVTTVAHRGLGTYRRAVDRFIALTEFGRDQFVRTGLPGDRIAVKPNFVDLEAPPPGPRSGALFVGRLSPEKGLRVLAEALTLAPEARATVIGEGAEQLAVGAHPGIAWRGRCDADAVYGEMRRARYLVMPSLWYEGFPRTLVEAYACGLPVIGSRLGSLAELIDEGQTGMLFEPGSATDLARCLRWMEDHAEEALAMGRRARQVFEERYTAERNYAMLSDIYRAASAVSEAARAS